MRKRSVRVNIFSRERSTFADAGPRTALRPSLVIQRKAISNGLLGDSVFWKIVAVALFLRGPLEGTFGRKSERLARYSVGPGHSVRVSTIKPLTRKQRKATGITKKALIDKARAELDDPNFRP